MVVVNIINKAFADYEVSQMMALGLVSAVSLVVYLVYRMFFSLESRIPGDLWARFTILMYRSRAARGYQADMAEEYYDKYGDIYAIGPGVIVLSNPADCRRVLGSHAFRKNKKVYSFFAQVGETMFSTSEPEVSNMRRRQFGPMFTHGYLAQMESTVLECGIGEIKKKWNRQVDQGDGKAVINFSQDFSLATFDVISALGFGQQFHALANNDSKIIQWVDNTIKLAIRTQLLPFARRYPMNLLTSALTKSHQAFIDFNNQIIDRRRQMVQAGKEHPKDILQALIDAEDPDSKMKLSADEITAENVSFLIAGTDTTSLTMTWFIHFMMLYPECYQRATAEVRAAFSPDHLVTYAESRASLPYLEACIYEVLRIRAVSGTTLPRIVPAGGARFQGHFLPAGTVVCASVAGLNHHTSVWANPKRFTPERFIDSPDLKQNVMTFSTGVRICPGRNLAYMEMFTILANLLKDYDLELPEGSLFGPDRLDDNGNPIPMPRRHRLTAGPWHPDRDCNIVVTKHST